MIDFPTFQAGVETLVANLLGLNVNGQMGWAAQADVFAADPTFATGEILIFGLKGVGVLDALTWSEVTANGPLVQTQKSNSEITLRITVTTYQQSPGLTARMYLERLRGRLAWDSTRDALQALSLGFQSALSLVDRSNIADARVASIAYLDLRMNLGGSDTDPTQASRISTVTFGPTFNR